MAITKALLCKYTDIFEERSVFHLKGIKLTFVFYDLLDFYVMIILKAVSNAKKIIDIF